MAKRSLRYFENPYQDDSVVDENGVKIVTERFHRIYQSLQNVKLFNQDRSLYLGLPGIAYAFLHLGDNHNLEVAQRYMLAEVRELERENSKKSSAFLCGEAGIYAVSAVLFSALGDTARSDVLAKKYADMVKTSPELRHPDVGHNEFFVGRAGYIYGALWLNKKLKKTVVPLEILHELAQLTVSSGKNYSAKIRSPCPLMYAYYETEYLGAAHGLSSILQTLIQIPEFLDRNSEAESLVRGSVDYLLSLEYSTGNYPCAIDEVGTHMSGEQRELVHWCHGAPGVIYCLAAAYLRWQDQRYLQACLRAGELIWRKGLLRKGPGICHGVAGNGYAFLLLYRLTGEQIHLTRAWKFALFLDHDDFQRHARTPDNPLSLYEGTAGTLCFLADLERPNHAAFPFQDVFLST